MEEGNRFLDYDMCALLNDGGADPDSTTNPPSFPPSPRRTSCTSTRSPIPSTPSTAAAGSRRRSRAWRSTRQGSYPDAYDGALFMADYSRECIWAMLPGTDGLPNRYSIVTVVSNIYPADLERGPRGDIFFTDVARGKVGRISYGSSANQAPVAELRADQLAGPVPLTVSFDASTPSTPTATRSRTRGTSTATAARDATGRTRPPPTRHRRRVVRVEVTYADGNRDVDTVTIRPGRSVPGGDDRHARCGQPLGGRLTHRVQRHRRTDGDDGALPPSAYSWQVVLNHCIAVPDGQPEDCHVHFVSSLEGASSGTLLGPDHDDLFSLELRLTVTDSDGLTATAARRIEPATVPITVDTVPSGPRGRRRGQTGHRPADGLRRRRIEPHHPGAVAPHLSRVHPRVRRLVRRRDPVPRRLRSRLRRSPSPPAMPSSPGSATGSPGSGSSRESTGDHRGGHARG